MPSAFWRGFGAGLLAFVGLSYVLHCYGGLGPWPCQRALSGGR